ncbi:MAG TPA: DUF3368 domain-containing protein [Synergistaceae bacterium]|nr:DUF3368 domain-containing protein [Synergistaceae bacterium]
MARKQSRFRYCYKAKTFGDQQGRRVAYEKGLSVTGTLGILIEARERGMIPSVRCELDRLIEAGMWIDEAFYHRILQEFGE